MSLEMEWYYTAKLCIPDRQDCINGRTGVKTKVVKMVYMIVGRKCVIAVLLYTRANRLGTIHA